MSAALHILSSMATRALLADLAAQWPAPVRVESVGGVDAAKRVAAGERFDAVVLPSAAFPGLVAGGHLAAGSRIDLVRSDVAIAVPSGAPRPSVADEAALSPGMGCSRRRARS